MVLDRRIDIDCFRSELERQPRDDLEVFVLYPVRRAIGGLIWGGRFWRARHAELDDVLEGLTTMGVLSDGLTTADRPIEAIKHALQTFPPDEVLIVRTRRLRRYEDSFRRILAAQMSESGRPIKTSWLPT